MKDTIHNIRYTTINGIFVPELSDIVAFIEQQGHTFKYVVKAEQDGNTLKITQTDGGSETELDYLPDFTKVTVSSTGTATELIPEYITISGTEYKTGSHDVPSNIVTTDTTQAISGQKTFNNDVYMGTSKRIMKANNLDHLALLGSNNNYSGASLFMYGTAGGGSENRGTFNLSACDGSTRHSLIGTIDGGLTWDGNDISGTPRNYTISAGSGTNITIYRQNCYKVGRMVFVSISGKNNTEIPEYGTKTAILTGFPPASYIVDVGVHYFDRSTNRGTRFQLNTSGNLMTDSEGFEANWFTFNFCYIAAS